MPKSKSGYDLQVKKLSLDSAKKSILLSALSGATGAMDEDMRRIYDSTAAQVEASIDRVLLTVAQVSIIKSALQHHQAKHGASPDAQAMSDQLTLTRAEFAAKYPSCA